MEIIKEGTIRITPRGEVRVEGFEIAGGMDDLRELALSRVRLAFVNNTARGRVETGASSHATS